ncbi:hypothetical protein C8R42DRAFT_723952 [Lentinula raphanica]|nr:hypothetical protein C8R42DRAFT_723952 [Lentinula raphanica]
MADRWYPIRDPEQIHVTGQAERELLRNDIDEEQDPESIELFIDLLVEKRDEIRSRLALDCAPYEVVFLKELCLMHARSRPHQPLTTDVLQNLRTIARKQAEKRVFQQRADRAMEERRAAAAERAKVQRMESRRLREETEGQKKKSEEAEEEEYSLL